MPDLYSCDGCGVLFEGRPRNHDECPVCEHSGVMREYTNGSKKRTDWYSLSRTGVPA